MYFCKNCGEQYATDEAVMCVKCGAPKGNGFYYCHQCGKPLPPQAVVCMNCGVAAQNVAIPGSKSKIVAGLLGIFLGSLGIHNFYLGYTSRAVLQLVLTIVGWLLTCVGIGVFLTFGIAVWGFIEGIMILTGKINLDGNGRRLTE